MVSEKEINEVFAARMRCFNVKGKSSTKIVCQITIPSKIVKKHSLKHGQYLVLKLLKAVNVIEEGAEEES
mgnify:CR=1 FL=1